MKFAKYLAVPSLLLASATLSAEEESDEFAIVNFGTCMSQSKYGQKEQENFEKLRSQVVSMIEQTENELKDISQKFEDADFMDTLSPKAEEELKIKYQSLSEDLNRYQNQYYQVLQNAQMQSVQKINSTVAKAAEKIAKEKGLSYVVNKEFCFYYKPSLEITDSVIDEMNEQYSIEEKEKKISEAKAIEAAQKGEVAKAEDTNDESN